MNIQHLSDEDLLLDYYGEAEDARRPELREHLAACAECRALDRELRGVLALVDTEPLPEAPVGFEREMWARLEPHSRGWQAVLRRPGVGPPKAGHYADLRGGSNFRGGHCGERGGTRRCVVLAGPRLGPRPGAVSRICQ